MIAEDVTLGKVETSFWPYGKGRGIQTAAAGRIEPDFSSSGHAPPSVILVAPASFSLLPALIVGLTLSVVLMGLAASVIARLLQRHHWIGYLGLVPSNLEPL